jgi:hypothetical protein
MKTYRVRFTADTAGDLLRLYDFPLEQDVAAAERALDKFYAGIDVQRGTWQELLKDCSLFQKRNDAAARIEVPVQLCLCIGACVRRRKRLEHFCV